VGDFEFNEKAAKQPLTGADGVVLVNFSRIFLSAPLVCAGSCLVSLWKILWKNKRKRSD
jgi:hypothetical protein